MQPHSSAMTSSPPELCDLQPGGSVASHGHHRPRLISSLFVAVALCLLAAVVAWSVGEFFLDLYKPSEEASTARFAFERLNREEAEAGQKNCAIAFGALGGLMGLALGVSGGIAGRSWRGAFMGEHLGIVLGVAVGIVASFAIFPLHQHNFRTAENVGNLNFYMGIHLGLWVPLGAAAGLAYAIGRFGFNPVMMFKGLIGGILGGVVGTGLFEVVSMSFPFDTYPTFPISRSSETRLAARLCVAVMSAIGAVLVTQSWKPDPAPTAGALRASK